MKIAELEDSQARINDITQLKNKFENVKYILKYILIF